MAGTVLAHPCTWEMKAGVSEVQSHPQLFSKLEALLGYLKFCCLFTHTLLLSLSPNTHLFSPKLTAKKYTSHMQKKSSSVITKYSYLTLLNIILFLYIIFLKN